MINLCLMLGAAFILVFAMMFILWIIYFVKRNAGIVDIGWAVGFILTAWIYLFLGDGFAPKKLLLTAMVTIWAGRLASHLYLRYISSPEDPRYVELRKSWGGDRSGSLFLMLFLFQGLLVIILSLPFLIVGHASDSPWSVWELVGVLIWGIGVAGEALADSQLKNFKANPVNNESVCEEGLWYFSRHPNYFFEWIVWIGFFIFALPTSVGWLAIISPILILALLTKVSGIPLSEAQALRKKGEAYRQYQETTSEFIPWFKKDLK